MKKIKIALLGAGTVGGGVWDILQTNKENITRNCGYEIEVEKILVKDATKKRKDGIPENLLTSNFEDIIYNDEIEIVVEVMGGIEPAKDYIVKALKQKKHVVTANKALLANHGNEIIKLAEDEGVQLYYEASVAGGIPIIQTLKESLAGNKIEKMMGILNGTTNYILTKMTKEKVDFDAVLKEAQAMGYAEADPTADVEGYDAAHKLTVLSSLAFGTSVKFDEVYREGISKITSIDIDYARELGYVIKLLAIGKEDAGTIEMRVHPTFISQSHPLASVNDSFNAIFIKGNAVGDLMLYGRGAGDLPTGSAVVGDIIAVIKGKDKPPVKAEEDTSTVKIIKPMGETESEYYIRLIVKDKPGVLGTIASLFGKHNVSLSSVLQKGEGVPAVSLVFITHCTREADVQEAIEEIITMEEVVELANLIRVENGKKRAGAQ
ncbi:homoserine dehydrogenase [Clostridium formicaceticum]|uniref:Homoserine dehydrogenase n=1 Tax=Clostridium formicaceticum TaxID=1497 RepID=A0AAC9RM66_9CLOT|nr:homoserine dehydrogenase [Clostridium formicaceticum]AOY75212.1 homoserine dehydrogenase [Clostridium formicaceticum]ARE89644.1 Homoserine dehydrogenase [Clostridium formicaceticum]